MSVTQREELRAHEQPAAHTQPLPAQLCHSPASLSLEADRPNLAGAASGTETPNPPPSNRHFEAAILKAAPVPPSPAAAGAEPRAVPPPVPLRPGRVDGGGRRRCSAGLYRSARFQRATGRAAGALPRHAAAGLALPLGGRRARPVQPGRGHVQPPGECVSPSPHRPVPFRGSARAVFCPQDSVPVSTSLLGDPSDTASACLAQRLGTCAALGLRDRTVPLGWDWGRRGAPCVGRGLCGAGRAAFLPGRSASGRRL